MKQDSRIDTALANARTSFRWESELCSSFRYSVSPNIWSKLESGQWLVVEESTCSDGRADQVWARLDPGWSCDILVANASILVNRTASRILAALQQKKRIPEIQLRALVGVTQAALRKALKALLLAELIEALVGNLYRIARKISFPKIEICAFEMKLENWKRALYQSTRYRSFSHRVFVVMPDTFAEVAISKINQFEKVGIGLMTHAPDGTTKVIVRPNKKAPRSSYQSLMALGMLLSRGSELHAN
jgi:DNA-binding transcriptional ArsR family regulator